MLHGSALRFNFDLFTEWYKVFLDICNLLVGRKKTTTFEKQENRWFADFKLNWMPHKNTLKEILL